MPANLVSPLILQTTPFASETAWLDALGIMGQWHQELARSTGTSVRLLDDMRQGNLASHAAMHTEVADSLGISRVGDLESFDLENEESYISFLYLEATDLERMRRAAGL